MRISVTLLLILSGGCKEKSDRVEAKQAKVAIDVVQLPVERVDVALDFGTVSISIPKGMRLAQTEHAAIWRFADGDGTEPTISVTSESKATLAGVTRRVAAGQPGSGLSSEERIRGLVRAMADDPALKPTTQRPLPEDGALVSFETADRSRVRVVVERAKDGWQVLCDASLSPRTTPPPSFDALKEWAERTCLTLNVESVHEEPSRPRD